MVLIENRFSPIFYGLTRFSGFTDYRHLDKCHSRQSPIITLHCVRETAAGATCQYRVVHRPTIGVACPMKGGSALTHGWVVIGGLGFSLQGFTIWVGKATGLPEGLFWFWGGLFWAPPRPTGWQSRVGEALQDAPGCYSVLLGAAGCSSVLQLAPRCPDVLQAAPRCCKLLQCVQGDPGAAGG